VASGTDPKGRYRAPIALAAAAFAVASTFLAAGSGCEEGGAHVYHGRYFDESRGCLESITALDVVPGDETGDCTPLCLVQPTWEGGRSLYVSTACAPYPHGFDVSGSDPRCAAVLAAFARVDLCRDDGTSSHPLEGGADGPDARPDADADDASVDSP